MPRLTSINCEVESRVLTKAVTRASRAMGITQKELSEIIGLSPTSILRMNRGVLLHGPFTKILATWIATCASFPRPGYHLWRG